MLTEGLDVKGLDLAIILHNSSSSTERIQKMGRVLRLEENKKAEIFSILIRDTVEEQWFKKSAKNTEFIELNEYELDYVLKNYKINKQPVLQKEERYIITY
jgi:superfamily II DNA or RNA helicase